MEVGTPNYEVYGWQMEQGNIALETINVNEKMVESSNAIFRWFKDKELNLTGF